MTDKSDGFTVVNNTLLTDGDLSPQEKIVVLIILKYYRSKLGHAWVYNGIIATQSGLSKRQVCRILGQLENKKAITRKVPDITEKDYYVAKCNTYTINEKYLWKSDDIGKSGITTPAKSGDSDMNDLMLNGSKW